jgi:4-diphosphocytidyl-2-C-methyl-D-erythritol kinase
VKEIIYKAPAKINLFLHVTGKNENGFHNLQTYFQLIDLYDTIKIKPTDTTQVETVNMKLAMNDNLAYRAVLLWQKETNSRQNVHIKIEKNIPSGAGLGGASSNAACVLKALNETFCSRLPQKKLLYMARELGCDVPIFVYGKSAYAEGVGDVIKHKQLTKEYYLLVYPRIYINTGLVFSHFKLTNNNKYTKMSAFDFRSNRNDCLPVVLRLYPRMMDVIADIKQAKKKFNLTNEATLTGTGSCLFVKLTNLREGEKIKTQLEKKYTCFIVKSL